MNSLEPTAYMIPFTPFYVKECNRRLNDMADNLKQSYIQRGNCPETQKNLDALENYGEIYRRNLSAFSRSENLNEIYCEISRLENLLNSEAEDFLSEIDYIKSRSELVENVLAI